MLAISSLGDIPLGERLEEAVDRFDEDEAFRLEVLGHTLSIYPEPMK